MDSKKNISPFGIFSETKKYGLPFWQSPTFLFLIFGGIIIFSSVFTYFLGTRYIEDPRIVALFVLFLTALLLIISFSLTKSFEVLFEANRIKTEFLHVVSHQLRGPLVNARWVLETFFRLKKLPLSEEEKKCLEILEENLDRLENLIKNLVLVAEIEKKKVFFQKEEISLQDLVKEVIEELQDYAKTIGVQINFQFRENLPKIFGPRFYLKQVVKHLLDNAIRYNRKGGKIEIKLEKRPKKIYFKIRDEGIGISKEEQKFLFRKFFRLESEVKYQTQGSGLGLYLSKAIVERLGGKIGFQSQKGKGSTFWFYLPLK
jgi:signal transduction histidine kinase